MKNNNPNQNPQEFFANLLAEYKKDADYMLDGLKVEISEKIYLAMEKRGVSQAELARRLGKSRAYITKILQGNVNFTLETLTKISQALDCRLHFNLTAKSGKRKRLKSAPKAVSRESGNLANPL